MRELGLLLFIEVPYAQSRVFDFGLVVGVEYAFAGGYAGAFSS